MSPIKTEEACSLIASTDENDGYRAAAEEAVAAHSSARPRWHYRIVPAAALVAIIGSVAIGMMRTDSDTAAAKKNRPIVNEPVAGEPLSTNSAPLRPQAARAPTVLSQTARQQPQRVSGTFTTTRRTQVYSEPTEASSLITNIEAGTKIHVVDSRDGWLEIRSKHGRPPGFIRQNAAVKAR
jgi:uncharacterized protein YgiM (DUF1202 family)